jgi:hypothetical protein
MQTPATERSTARSATRELLSPIDIDREYGIPPNTQAIWRCTNRYGFGSLVIKVGRSVRYKRADFEHWLESRRAAKLVATQ